MLLLLLYFNKRGPLWFFHSSFVIWSYSHSEYSGTTLNENSIYYKVLLGNLAVLYVSNYHFNSLIKISLFQNWLDLDLSCFCLWTIGMARGLEGTDWRDWEWAYPPGVRSSDSLVESPRMLFAVEGGMGSRLTKQSLDQARPYGAWYNELGVWTLGSSWSVFVTKGSFQEQLLLSPYCMVRVYCRRI